MDLAEVTRDVPADTCGMKCLERRKETLSSVGMRRSGRCGRAAVTRALDPRLDAIHIDEHHRRGEQREHLAQDQSTDDSDAQRTPQLGADTAAHRERSRA